MKHKILGKSGLIVSEVGLGSLHFGGATAAWDARQMLEIYVQQGGNFIDTANAYHGGEAEKIIGQWVADSHLRQHVIIGTKTYLPEDGDPNHRRLSRQAILYSVEQSLRRLQSDYIDLYYSHYWDRITPLEETLATFEALIQQGKVRYIACSNFFAWQVMKTLGLQQQRGWSPLIAVQSQYSLIERSIEREILPCIQHEGLGLVAWGALAGGFLSGKYAPDHAMEEKDRLAQNTPQARYYAEQSLNSRGWQILAAVQAAATVYGCSAAQMALAWVLHQPVITSLLIGPRALEHLDLNLVAAQLNLSADTLAQLGEVSRIDRGYPHHLLAALRLPD